MGNARALAEEMIGDRFAVIDKLEAAIDTAAERHAAADEADKSAASAWNDAIKAGWKPAELKRMGLQQPQPKRGRKPAAVSRKTSTSVEDGKDGDSAPEHNSFGA